MISTVHSSYGIEINIPRKRQVLYQQVITISKLVIHILQLYPTIS